MRRKSKKLTGKIATVKNKYLNINKDGVHMVYIRKDHGKTVDVNVITSLEDYDKNNISHFRIGSINKIKKGEYYSISYRPNLFPKWSGVNLYKKENIPKSCINLKKDRILDKKDKMVISILGNKKRRI